MPLASVALAVAGLTVLALNICTSVYLSGLKTLTPNQRFMQLAIVWLVPLVGAAVVYFFHRADAEPRGPDKPTVGPFEGMEG